MTKEDIFQIITDHTKEVVEELKNHNFSQTDSLKDLGANSIDRAEILTMTMESLELDVPRTELFGAKNMGDLAEIFYAKKSQS